MRKKKRIKYYNYECTITGQSYRTTEEAPNPDDLVSVTTYYELNPEHDDRPENKKTVRPSVEEESSEES